ncbi:MAG: NAD(P)-dependent oxidoreductase [Syntrophales bacterium]|nr:NAD(P)-dependent oxidoreductase [Syntrophales bacterium]
MRSLVTGASGFIGSRLAQTLSKRFGQSNVQLLFPPLPKHAKEKKRADELALFGFDIVYADLLKLPADFSDHIKPFDVLYHLAAFGETESKDIHLNDVNDIGTQMLLSALSRRLKRARMVFTSTLAAVDRSFPDNMPLSEDYPCHPRTAYGISKLKAEANVKSGADLMGYEWIILRLPTIIGAGYRSGGLMEAIVESLRRHTLFARLNWPGRIEVVHVNDVAEILVRTGTTPIPINTLFHLSSGIAPTLDDLIRQTAQLLNVKRKRIAVPSFFWSLINKIIWIPHLFEALPFNLRLLFWRLSLMVTDGFVGNGAFLSRVIPYKFMRLREMLRETYQEHIK